jgi:hypothetical protein
MAVKEFLGNSKDMDLMISEYTSLFLKEMESSLTSKSGYFTICKYKLLGFYSNMANIKEF